MKKLLSCMMVFCTLFTSSVPALAADGADVEEHFSRTASVISDNAEEGYQLLVDKLLVTQYDALVSSDYSKIDSLFVKNDITSFYCSYLKYRVDAAFEFDNYWLDYSYKWRSFEAKEVDGKISFAGVFDLYFTYASELDGAQPGVQINGTIETTSDDMYLSNIDTSEVFYSDLKENLRSQGLITTKEQSNNSLAQNSADLDATAEVIIDINAKKISSFLDGMLDDLKDDRLVEHKESKEIVSANPVVARAAYSYNANAGVSYANNWYYRRNIQLFPDLRLDCTNFVSQCVWAAYSNKMESSASLSNWFAHTNGCGTPWENVEALWNYSTTRTGTQTGPRAAGYNNGGLYTGIPAYAMTPGNVVQFQFPDHPSYGHSVYVVSNNATNYNNYGSVVFTQHTSDIKGSIQDKISSYGPQLKMRRLNFSTAQF